MAGDTHYTNEALHGSHTLSRGSELEGAGRTRLCQRFKFLGLCHCNLLMNSRKSVAEVMTSSVPFSERRVELWVPSGGLDSEVQANKFESFGLVTDTANAFARLRPYRRATLFQTADVRACVYCSIDASPC